MNILLEVKNLKKSFFRNGKLVHEALKGINLQLFEGEIISLLGVNGAGKTTLSSIIASLNPPTEGEVLFRGKSIYNDLVSYRMQLGFCQQRPNLNGYITLQENLEFSGRFYGMSEPAIVVRITELTKQFELAPYLSQKAEVLSGGFKQRFMLARSLMHKPKLLLLDEPTVGLDPHIRRQLWDRIRELKQEGVTVLLTTHYLDEAEKLSDRVCILDQGVIKLVDTPENLMKDFKQNNLEDVFVALMEEKPKE